MNNNNRNFFPLNQITKIIVIIVMILSCIGAQDLSREKAPLSFVFLPLRASQLHQMEVEQFMDEFIKVLRMRGHNAVSTRYLKSVLLDSRLGELDACTTQVCMSQLVRLLGTRFLIHGSLQIDSSMTYVVNVKVIDVPNNAVVTIQQDNFTKNPGISATKTAEFTDKILSSVNDALIGAVGLPVTNLLSNESVVSQNTGMEVPSPDTIEKFSDSSGHVPDPAEGTQNMIVDSLVEQTTEIVSDSSTILSMVDTSVVDTANTLVISNHDNDSGVDSAKVLDTATVVLSVSPPPTVSLTIPELKYQSDGPAAPPEALKRENVRKKLKIVRISTFGTITLAAFSGGIVINSAVRKSLDKEKVFFNTYMQADEHQADAAYQTYFSQTEKTDAKMRQRSFLYTLGMLGLAGGVISFKF